MRFANVNIPPKAVENANTDEGSSLCSPGSATEGGLSFGGIGKE